MTNKQTKEKSIYESIRLLAPGTKLREALENIVKAKTGALIVIGDNEEVLNLVDGGFKINSPFTSAHLYELAKMDGAIILNDDAKKILYANAHLTPNSSIISKETGTRHKTAERVAKQTGKLVISISQRRNIITLYKNNYKYVLKDVSDILTKANQAIKTLDKYKVVLDKVMNDLSVLEFEDSVTVFDVVKVIQRIEMVIRIVIEIEKYILELGNEGRLISMQVNELTDNVKEDAINVVKDYYVKDIGKDADEVMREIRNLSSEEVLDLIKIAKVLGYNEELNVFEINVSPRGYRVLSKIPRLPSNVLNNVIINYNSLQEILNADISQLNLVEGIGDVRAKTIIKSLKKIKHQALLSKHT